MSSYNVHLSFFQANMFNIDESFMLQAHYA
jgi:hypothetical protein